MSLVHSIGTRLDRMGMRRFVAIVATIVYKFRSEPRRYFGITERGQWSNRQSEATFVSPTVHTSPYAVIEQKLLDQWAFDYLPSDGDTIIDVGAGIGEEAVVFSRLVGEFGRVISIEAHPETFACLEETVRLSDLSNVTILPFAVNNCDGEVSIAGTDDHLSNSIVSGYRTLQVQAKSLSTICRESNVTKVDLLKINIEGAEMLALSGLHGFAACVAHIVVSCHDFLADRGGPTEFRTFDSVRQWLVDSGFAVRTRPDHGEEWIRYYIYARNKAFE